MDKVWIIGKGLLKFTFLLLKIAVTIMNATFEVSEGKGKKHRHCSSFLAEELYEKGEITKAEYNQALRRD